jgi:uncharacterized membrane protein
MSRWIYLSIALTVAAFAFSGYLRVYRYDDIPAQVPIHWNIEGKADQWIPKEKTLWVFGLMPLCMAGFTALTMLLPWLSPKHFDVDRFRNTYGYVMAVVVALFGYIHVITMLGSMEWSDADLGRWLVSGIFLFFALIGNVMGQVRRNFWMGVRTPWTLASERVWNQTHRLFAWLMVAAGAIGFLAVIAGVNLIVCIAGLLIAVFTPVIYSFVLYKRLEKQGKLENVAP